MIPAPLVVDFLVEIESTIAARSQVLTGLHLKLWLTTCSVWPRRRSPSWYAGHARLCTTKNVHPRTPPVERRVWRTKVATV